MDFNTRYSNQRVNTDIVGDSRTRPEFADDADINNILKKFKKYGQLPDMIKKNPQYGDFTQVPTYQEALHITSFAHEQFNALSAKVRRRFDNDPAQFLAFTNNPANKEEMYDLKLAIRPAIQATAPDASLPGDPPHRATKP